MATVSVPYQDRHLLTDHLSTLDGFLWIHTKTISGQDYDLLAFKPAWIVTDCSTAEVSRIENIFKNQPCAQQPTSAFFNGGLAGYIGYDFTREKTHSQFTRPLAKTATGLYPLPPKAYIGYYPTNYLIVDHQGQTISGDVVDPSALKVALQKKAAKQTTAENQQMHTEADNAFRLTSAFTPDWSRSRYQVAFERIKHYLLEGDCYQVNLTQRLTASYQGESFAAFKQVLAKHKSTHFAFLRTGMGDVLSFSPESFLSIDNGHICTKPIKGTRKRHPDPAEDRRIAEHLLASAKDRAENVMIVDLLRNDLGRIAKTGSVKVRQLCELESISNVHHLVSMICAELQDQISPFQALLACSPGGSITGAPKIRAMEIIDELEDFSRNVYCGSVFHYAHNGRLESNIAIRTLTCKDGAVSIWGGGGIVADSVEKAEHEESLFKIKHIIDVLTTTLKD